MYSNRSLSNSSFNPRARTGRDDNSFLADSSSDCFNPRARTGRDVMLRDKQYKNEYCFNPRARTGRDMLSLPSLDSLGCVSIHAPARGATHQSKPDLQGQDVSTHAPARGATSSGTRKAPPSLGFNPRARTGRDGNLAGNWSRGLAFQSTRPHGARHTTIVDTTETELVSIHAPARGATTRTD